jgi:hypothetical protein
MALGREALVLIIRLAAQVDMLGYNSKNFGASLHAELKKENFLTALKPSLLATEKVVRVRPFLGSSAERHRHILWSRSQTGRRAL